LYAVVEIVGVMLDLAAHRSTEIPPDVKQRLGLG
jgi:acyl-CoA thioesterase FadM